jgi:hypothetical protein
MLVPARLSEAVSVSDLQRVSTTKLRERVGVSKVRVAGFDISLDAFGAGIDQSLEDPLGTRGRELFQWFFPTKTSCSMAGRDGRPRVM